MRMADYQKLERLQAPVEELAAEWPNGVGKVLWSMVTVWLRRLSETGRPLISPEKLRRIGTLFVALAEEAEEEKSGAVDLWLETLQYGDGDDETDAT